MEKYAFEIVEDVLEKCARSYNAKRNKQYWQMMKKIHGGTDEAVNNITKNRAIDSLIAANNTANTVSRNGEPILTNIGQQLHGMGGNKRLKTPSELWGSKTLYPETAEFNNAAKSGHNLSKSMISRKRDIPEELLEDTDFIEFQEKFMDGKSSGKSRSFKELDERAQALGKKIAPPNLNRSQNDISLGEEISKASTKKSKKPILAGLGVAGAGAGAGIGSSVRKAIKSKDAAKAQEKLKKKMALGAGAGVAGTLGAGAAYKHNNRDKAAFEIVNDILSK